MNDATLSWQAAPSSPKATGYSVVWIYNGAAQPPVTVPRTAALDASGYTLDAATSIASVSPTITIGPGDTIDATVTTVDATDNLVSTPVTPPAVTEPIAAPNPPANVTLVLA